MCALENVLSRNWPHMKRNHWEHWSGTWEQGFESSLWHSSIQWPKKVSTSKSLSEQRQAHSVYSGGCWEIWFCVGGFLVTILDGKACDFDRFIFGISDYGKWSLMHVRGDEWSWRSESQRKMCRKSMYRTGLNCGRMYVIHNLPS